MFPLGMLRIFRNQHFPRKEFLNLANCKPVLPGLSVFPESQSKPWNFTF